MAYYALHKLKIPPGELMGMTEEEKAFIYAAIDMRIENEKKEMAKAKKK